MKLPPRTTRALALASLFALAPACPCVTALHFNAGPRQTSTTTATRQQPTPNRRDAKTREQRAARARERRVREQAVAALAEAAEAVRPADDLYEAVSLRAEIAEVLWPHDAPAARAMLRRAWEAANAPGAEERVKGFGIYDDEREDSRQALHTARRSVVKTALKHDPPLGEEFMRRFERETSAASEAPPAAAGEAAGVEAAPPSSTARGARTLTGAGWQRLLVATQFLADGEHGRAAATAAPLVAEGPTTMLLDFIADLRARAPRESDALYLRLLERTRADPDADANDVLLLSAPVVSPTLRARVEHDGSVSFSPLTRRSEDEGNAGETAPLPAEVRRAFFNVAAAVLLRPRANAGLAATQRADAAAQVYFTASRLLPFFEREAPRHAPALHALLASLAAELETGRRDLLASRAGVSSLTQKNPVDGLASPLKAVADAPNETERDWERFLLVSVAARRRLWDRARAAAADIVDEETRRNARRALAMRQVMDTLHAFENDTREKRDDERGAGGEEDAGERADHIARAAEFVRAADVPAEVSAAGLAQAAELAARSGEKERAAELLGEAVSFAEQSERAAGRRTLALALVTLSAARLSDARAWDTLSALVRAADAEGELDFAALAFDYTFNHLGRSVSFTPQRQPLDLREVFAAAARLDLARTLAEARALRDDILRANMLLAAARAALEKTAKPGAKTAPRNFLFDRD